MISAFTIFVSGMVGRLKVLVKCHYSAPNRKLTIVVCENHFSATFLKKKNRGLISILLNFAVTERSDE